jgi:hypothetical protein
MSKRDMNEGSGRRDAGGNTEDVDRRAGVPERMGKDAAGSRFTDRDVAKKAPVVKKEIEYPLFPRKKDKETFVRPTAAGGNSKTPTVVTRPTGDDRFVSPEEGAKANKPRRTPGAADGVGSTFSSSEEGMAANVPRRTVPDYSNEGRGSRAPGVASSTAEGMAAYVPRRPGQTTPQATSSSTAEGMAANVPRRPVVASSTAAGMAANVPRRTTTASDNAQAQARMMRQGSPMAASRRNAGMPGYDEAGNPIAMRSMAGQRGYDEAGNKMNRGGAVRKMASGGMTSSKMSKPSGASRGDGIAQRGKTRGTLR